MRNQDLGGELMRGVDESPRALEPRLNPPRRTKKIPAKNDRRHACARISAASDRRRVSRTFKEKRLVMRSRRISLPQRHNVGPGFKLSGKNAGMQHRRQWLARLKPSPEKFEAGAISNTESVIDKRAVFPTARLANLSNRIVCNFVAILRVTGRCLRTRDCGSPCQHPRHNHQ